ncbi:MAG: hypothetical protein AAF772_09770 [Acidobacteriota bacterium]
MSAVKPIELPPLPEGAAVRKRDVAFLLGTDEHIPAEARVGLAPRHLTALRTALEAQGLAPRLFVHAGAGARARAADAPDGFTDAAYRDAGAEVVTPAQLAQLGDLDVVHALKEPTTYEADLQGGFLRVGALHLASRPPGVCRMLQTRTFGGLFDGATIGSCSHLVDGGDRTPIVGSMSRFAGTVAGARVRDTLAASKAQPGRIVVIGGGVAGRSAIEQVADVAGELVVVEPYRPLHRLLAARLWAKGLGENDFRLVQAFTPDLLDDAIGLVFAHRSGARAAEKVCTLEDVLTMRAGAAIADIAVDQGGSILVPGYRETDDAVTNRDRTNAHLEAAARDYTYYAEVNMPREMPHPASDTHGDAVAPYVALLLLLCGVHGGPAGAMEAICAHEPQTFTDVNTAAALSPLARKIMDVRNGLQLAVRRGEVRIMHPDIEADQPLSSWVRGCAAG